MNAITSDMRYHLLEATLNKVNEDLKQQGIEICFQSQWPPTQTDNLKNLDKRPIFLQMKKGQQLPQPISLLYLQKEPFAEKEQLQNLAELTQAIFKKVNLYLKLPPHFLKSPSGTLYDLSNIEINPQNLDEKKQPIQKQAEKLDSTLIQFDFDREGYMRVNNTKIAIFTPQKLVNQIKDPILCPQKYQLLQECQLASDGFIRVKKEGSFLSLSDDQDEFRPHGIFYILLKKTEIPKENFVNHHLQNISPHDSYFLGFRS